MSGGTRSMAGACMLAVALAFGGSEAGAQQLIFYPAAGQSQAQLNSDRAECQQWATGQTGFDPAFAGQQAAQAQAQVANSYTSPPPSTREGAVLRGAAGGALIGGIAGGNAGRGAAAGALFGGIRRASASQERARWEQQQTQHRQAQSQQISARYQQGLDTWNRATAACMQSRGYQPS